MLVALAMAAAAVLLAYWSRGLWFSTDDLDYATRLANDSLGHALLYPPSNKYLIAVPLLFYKATFEVFGIDTYVPERVVGLGLVLLSAGLLFALLRKRVGDLAAVPPVLLMLFFGAGWEAVLTPVRIPSQFALVAGLGTLLALERRDLRGDLAAMVLLAVSLASHPVGISFAAAATVMIVLRSREGWRALWVVAVPGALFAVWWLFLRPPTTPSLVPNRASDVFPFVRDSWASVTAAVTGLFGVLDDAAFHEPLAWIAAALLLVLIAVGVAWSWRRLPPIFWAALVGLLVLMATTRLSPGGFLRVPDEPRYLYPEAFYLLILLGALAGTVRLRGWPLWLASGILLISLWPNIDRLIDSGRGARETFDGYRAEWSAVEIAGPNAQPGYRPDFLSPTAAEYLTAVRAYGRGGYSVSQLASRPNDTRRLADSALVRALGIRLVPAAGPKPAAQRCATAGRGGSSAAPLPASGVWIGPGPLASASFYLGRFADQPSARLTPPATPGPAVLRVPPGTAGPPWRLLVQSTRALRVCGLAGAPSP